MVVIVHLHTAIREHQKLDRGSSVTLTLPSDSRIQDVLDQLEVTFPSHGLLLVVNRRTVGPEQVLAEGDIIHLIPAISGGSVRVK
ncbi:MAG: MoaD/ThiS family protein [Chloroflexi bacterium]|nr:MoaD/ThiS family protein [Chloroflexota bacterium]